MLRQLFVLVSALVVLGSCDWNVEPQYSPEIYGSHFYVNPVFEGDSIISAKDTLRLSNGAADYSYKLDTLYLGDTVMFSSIFYSVNNNLVSVRIDWDSTKMKLWYTLPADVDKVLTSQTNLQEGDMYFAPGYNRLAFPIWFTPLVKGAMSFSLSVDSDSEYSRATALFHLTAK